MTDEELEALNKLDGWPPVAPCKCGHLPGEHAKTFRSRWPGPCLKCECGNWDDGKK